MSPGSGFVDPAAQRNVAMRVVPTLVQTALWRTARAYPSILPSRSPSLLHFVRGPRADSAIADFARRD